MEPFEINVHSGDLPGVDDNDTVIIGFPNELETAITSSSHHVCEKCNANVRISPDSMDTVLDNVNQHGGKVHVICMSCCPPEAFDSILLGPLQKAEMLKHGMDIDAIAKAMGVTIEQLQRISVLRLQIKVEMERMGPDLQRAAKEGLGKGGKPAEDGRGGFEADRAIQLIIALKLIGRNEVGALRFGRMVRKIGSEPGDRTPDGTLGEIMGSASLPNQEPVVINGLPVTYGYLVKWTTDDLPVFTVNLKIEEVK